MENIENNTVLLYALAEIRKHQIIQTKFNKETNRIYTDAYVYAIAHSLYPYEHEQLGFEEDKNNILRYFPFYETYSISYEQVKDVAELLDRKWRAEEDITFYGLEDHYRDRETLITRADLIHICRYLYLSGYYTTQPLFWKNLLKDSPTEANHLDETFDPSQLEQTSRILGH